MTPYAAQSWSSIGSSNCLLNYINLLPNQCQVINYAFCDIQMREIFQKNIIDFYLKDGIEYQILKYVLHWPMS